MPSTSYYDAEAPRYDESRGGQTRARQAAEAVARLAGADGVLLDLAGGTGQVSAELARIGFSPVVADLSHGMLRLAAARVPGRVLLSQADRLPLADACVDVVSTIWLLHLLSASVADAAVAEVARVLRDGGVWVTTLDKSQAHGFRGAESDDRRRVTAVAREHGLVPCGETTFTGPSEWGSATDGDPEFPVVAFSSTPDRSTRA